MKLDYRDTLALLDRLLESEPKTDRPGGFTVRLRRMRDLVGEKESADIKLSAIYSHVFPGVSKNSLRTTMMEFRKSLAQAVEKAGLRFELVRPDARGVEVDEVICHFEGEELALVFDNADAEIALGRERQIIEPRARATRVFISFAVADQKLAVEFTQQLKVNLPLRCAEPVSLWRFDDRGGILPGEQNELEISKQMEESQFGILLISPTYLDRPFIKRVELPHFLGPDAKAHPIPVALSDFTPGVDRHPLLDALNVFQHQGRNFKNTAKKDRAEFIKVLCGQIAALIAKHPPPPFPRKNANRTATDPLLLVGNDPSLPDQGEYTPLKGRSELSLAKSAAWSEDLSRGSVPVLETLEEWVKGRRESAYMALLGESGSGKTMTCSKLNQALNAKRPGSSIYIDLRRLNESGLLKKNAYPKLKDILLATLSRTSASPASPEEVLTSVQSKGALLIWDGLDEVLVHLSAQEGEAFVGQLKNSLPPRALENKEGTPGRLLIACRTQYFRTVEHEASTLTQSQRGAVNASSPKKLRARFRVLRLLPFDDDQIRAYLAANVPGLDVERAFDLIQKIHDLHDLAKRPYCLSLLRPSLPDLDRLLATGSRVRSVDLYKSLVRSWLARDTAKHRFEEDDKPKLMARLAGWMWREGAKTVSAERLGAWLKETVFSDPTLRYLYGDDFKEAKKRDELLQDFRTATFIARWDGDFFRFAHTSLQEYFLASHLVDSLESGAINAWSLPRVNRETFDFAAEIFIDRAEESDAVRKRIEDSLARLLGESMFGRSENALLFLMRLHATGQCMFQAPKVNCSGLDLTAWEFSGSTAQLFWLADADFSRATLVRARFHNVEASRSRWDGADLRSAEFVACKLAGADFNGERGNFPRLEGARLRNCGLYGSRPPSLIQDGFRIELPQWDFRTEGMWQEALSRKDSATPFQHVWTSPICSAHALKDSLDARWSFGHSAGIVNVAISPTGSLVASSSDDNSIRLWDPSSGQCIQVLTGHSKAVNCAAFSPDGLLVASSSHDNTIRIWDVVSGQCIRILTGHSSAVNCVAFSPNSLLIASGSNDSTIRLWDAGSGACTRILMGHSEWIGCIAFSPDGILIASGSGDSTIRLWDSGSGECKRILTGHFDWVDCVGFSPDGALVGSGSHDGSVRLWDSGSGRQMQIHKENFKGITAIAFSNDNSLFVSNLGDDCLWLLDGSSDRRRRAMTGHSQVITCFAFSSEGRFIISGSSDNSLRRWDSESGVCTRIFSGHPDCITGAALSLDGDRLVSDSRNGGLRVWDAGTGRAFTVSDEKLPFLRDSISRGTSVPGMVSELGTLRISTEKGIELDIAALPNKGYAVLEKAPGETRWRLARARGEYWRYVNYVSDSLPDGTPGRVLYSADALGEVPEV